MPHGGKRPGAGRPKGSVDGAGRVTLKHGRFVAEYLKDLNATQAAIRAGYGPKNADVVGPRLLGKVAIAAAVAAGAQQQAERLGLTVDAVREQNAFIAKFD